MSKLNANQFAANAVATFTFGAKVALKATVAMALGHLAADDFGTMDDTKKANAARAAWADGARAMVKESGQSQQTASNWVKAGTSISKKLAERYAGHIAQHHEAADEEALTMVIFSAAMAEGATTASKLVCLLNTGSVDKVEVEAPTAVDKAEAKQVAASEAAADMGQREGVMGSFDAQLPKAKAAPVEIEDAPQTALQRAMAAIADLTATERAMVQAALIRADEAEAEKRAAA